MKTVARAYLLKRECLLQDAVYQIMPKSWLRKVFAVVVNINSNVSEKELN